MIYSIGYVLPLVLYYRDISFNNFISVKFKRKVDFYELGEAGSEEELNRLFIVQLTAHGMTEEEAKKWLKESDEGIKDLD